MQKTAAIELRAFLDNLMAVVDYAGIIDKHVYNSLNKIDVIMQCIEWYGTATLSDYCDALVILPIWREYAKKARYMNWADGAGYFDKAAELLNAVISTLRPVAKADFDSYTPAPQ